MARRKRSTSVAPAPPSVPTPVSITEPKWYQMRGPYERLRGRLSALLSGLLYRLVLTTAVPTASCDMLGKTIYVNPGRASDLVDELDPVLRRKLEYLFTRAMLGHEVLHAKYSDPEPFAACHKEYRALGAICNILEDARIEAIGASTSFVDTQLFAFMAAVIRKGLPQFTDLAFDDPNSLELLLLHWRFNKPLPDLTAAGKLKWLPIRRLAYQAVYADTTEEVADISRQIASIAGLSADNAKMGSSDENELTGTRTSKSKNPMQKPDNLDDPYNDKDEEKQAAEEAAGKSKNDKTESKTQKNSKKPAKDKDSENGSGDKSDKSEKESNRAPKQDDQSGGENDSSDESAGEDSESQDGGGDSANDAAEDESESESSSGSGDESEPDSDENSSESSNDSGAPDGSNGLDDMDSQGGSSDANPSEGGLDGDSASDSGTGPCGKDNQFGGNAEQSTDSSPAQESSYDNTSEDTTIETLVESIMSSVNDNVDDALDAASKEILDGEKNEYSHFYILQPALDYLNQAAPIIAQIMRELKVEQPRASCGPDSEYGKFHSRYYVRSVERPWKRKIFRGDETPTMALFLLLDLSGSMCYDTENLRVLTMAVYEVCRQLKIPLTIAAFDDTYEVIKKFDEWSDIVPMRIAGLRPNGQTVLAPGLRDAFDQLKRRPETTKHVIVVHDGGPHDNRATIADAMQQLRTVADVFGIYIARGDSWSESTYVRNSLDTLFGTKHYQIAPMESVGNAWCVYVKQQQRSKLQH